MLVFFALAGFEFIDHSDKGDEHTEYTDEQVNELEVFFCEINERIHKYHCLECNDF